MTSREIRFVHLTAKAHLLVALGFLAFFQLGKAGPLREVNPFGEDPYDAVGSIAIQLALLSGLLSYARALRLIHSPGQVPKVRLILRGDLLVLAAIFTTLVTDAVAEVAQPRPLTTWGSILLLGLVGLALLATLCAVLLGRAFARIRPAPPPTGLTLAEAIDDLWSLVRIPLARSVPPQPNPILNWVLHLSSDRLFSGLPWLNPRLHPWRFAAVGGALSGGMLGAAQLREGWPPNLMSGILLVALFISAELSATLVGFGLLGRYLGLRPSSTRRPTTQSSL